jgi:hypothetical protein
MAFKAQVVLIDSMGREVTKNYECEATVLATAQTDVAALITTLEAITDLGVVKVNYSVMDASEASAAAAGSNRDVGATFKLRAADGGTISHKVPGFDATIADGAGNIDPEDEAVVAYFANFLSAGAFTLNDGEVITAILSGSMDK